MKEVIKAIKMQMIVNSGRISGLIAAGIYEENSHLAHANIILGEMIRRLEGDPADSSVMP